MSITEVVATDPDNLPIRDTDPLLKRIAALDEEQQSRLMETWHANGLGMVEPLETTENFKVMERLVANVEHSITGAETWERQQNLTTAIDGLPENIRAATLEALDVYAPTVDMTITTAGRLVEAERIVAEALAYAAEIEAAKALHPSSLPPLDEPTQAEVAAEMADYPGTKAKADEVLAWVGEDRNRAARAFMHEEVDRKPRKGVTEKLAAILGADLIKVYEAIHASEPPPLDLAAAPAALNDLPAAPPLGADGNTEGSGGPSVPGAGAKDVPASEGKSVEGASLPTDVEPPAPEERSEKASIYLEMAAHLLRLAEIEDPALNVVLYAP